MIVFLLFCAASVPRVIFHVIVNGSLSASLAEMVRLTGIPFSVASGANVNATSGAWLVGFVPESHRRHHSRPGPARWRPENALSNPYKSF
jgi:hypothetical protein